MALEETRVGHEEAERRVFADRVESQDSQILAAELHHIYGVGLRSSSLVRHSLLDEPFCRHQNPAPRLKETGSRVSKNSTTRVHNPTRPHPNCISNASASARASKPRGRSKRDPALSAGRDKDQGHDGIAAASLNQDRPDAPRAIDASNSRVAGNHYSNSQPQEHVRHIAQLEKSASGVPASELTTTSRHKSHPDLSLLSAIGEPTISPPSIPVAHGNEDDDDSHGDADKSSTSPMSGSSTNNFSIEVPIKRQKDKMDCSQSPTQSNDGRSYEQYEQQLSRGDDLMSSDPIRPAQTLHRSRRSSPAFLVNDNTTIEDDDTGAVDFDFSALAQRDTQISVPDSLRLTANPETPAPPKNPFAGSKAALMASSQLFTHTQFSSAYKTFSPTSSRPSPDNILLNALNSISPNPSPTKGAKVGPSPLRGAPSSLPDLPLALDSSPQKVDDDQDSGVHVVGRAKNSVSFPFPSRNGAVEIYNDMRPFETRLTTKKEVIPPDDLASQSSSDSDEDISQGEARRRQRQRVLLKKAAVSRRLQAISFGNSDGTKDDVVPSTTREECSQDSATDGYTNQYEGFPMRDSQNPIEDTQGIEDSQVVQLSADAAMDQHSPTSALAQHENTSSNEGVVPNTDPDPDMSAVTIPVDGFGIPETSPPKEQLRSLGGMMPASSDIIASATGSFSKLLPSSPPLASCSLANAVSDHDIEARAPAIQSSPPLAVAHDAKRCTDDENGVSPHVPISPAVESSPPAPAFGTRARLRGSRREAAVTAYSTSSPQSASSISTLSKLTATPTISDRVSPASEESPRSAATPSSTGEVKSSPTVAKAQRRRNTATVVKAAPQTPVCPATRRHVRQPLPSDASDSTDELAKTPRTSTPAPEQNERLSRLGRATLQELTLSRDTSRGGKIFAGMSFAISFQSKQHGEKEPHYDSRVARSSEISTKIKQGGGKVLTDGFEKLFDICPVKNAERDHEGASSTPCPDEEVKLTPVARETGFTALIADGHSRKVKYMQALALGLPCIHERWITTCVEKQRLVDWSDYLLCAGNSSFLGDAIRSRNLPVYDAAAAKLRHVIERRPRLLARSRILVVMPRADESKKAAYIFLARVLGASLSRVHNLDEAKQQLTAREDAGHPFDWVYIDEKTAGKADLFAEKGLSPSTSKKRKRKSEMVKDYGPTPKRIRTLSDELIIQSLILGRLMEEEEMS